MPQYQYFRSFTYREPQVTTNINDIFNPFKNEFFNNDATIGDFVEFMGWFLEENSLTDSKCLEIWPNSSAFFRLFVDTVKCTHSELLPYLFLADAYNYDDEICVNTPYENGQGNVSGDYFTSYAGAIRQLTASKNRLNLSMKLREFYLPVQTLLGRLKVYTMNFVSCFYNSGGHMSPREVRLTQTEPALGYEQNYDGNGYYWKAVLAPGQIDRAPLSRLFSHSQDVTRLLGSRTVAQRSVTRGGKEIKCDREGSPILYGVELEVSTNKTTTELVDAQVDVFLVGKSDGSITGSKAHAIELVTKPQDLRSHRRGWAKFMGSFFNKNSGTYPDFDVTKNTDNGMHVHIDRGAFVDEHHLSRLNYFMAHPLHADFVLAISERDKSSLQRWTKLPSWTARTSDKEVYRDAGVTFRGMGKYAAVNQSKSATIEIRIFKGIFSYATVMKNLEFCDALMHFTMEHGIAQLTLEGFMSWLNALPNRRYKALRMFLCKIDTDNMVETNKTNKLFAKAGTPEEALAIIEKKCLAQSKSLASLLNVKFGGKKAFHWDNKKGVLLLCHKDKATLHAHDGELQDYYGGMKPTVPTSSATL